MTTKGIDCATPLTAKTAKAIAAAGYQFAARYLVPIEHKWKRLTRAEAEAITAAGMQIVSVYEAGADKAAHGAAAGLLDGAAALQEALTIGQPVGSAIYFAVDFDAQPKHYDAIESYLRAAAAQIRGYDIGVYGSYAVVEEMAKRIPGIKAWQTYAWSGGDKSLHANLYQWRNGQTVAGVGVDLNESYGGEGAWDTNPVSAPEPVGEDKYKVVVNDKLVGYGRAIDGHVYLPLRQLGEALGKVVHWDNEAKKPYVDGKAVETFSVVDGTTYVGVRAAAELLGGVVSFDGKTKKVYLYK